MSIFTSYFGKQCEWMRPFNQGGILQKDVLQYIEIFCNAGMKENCQGRVIILYNLIKVENCVQKDKGF